MVDLHAAHAPVLDRGARPLRQRELGVDLVDVPLDEKANADADRVGLFAGLREKNQIAIERHARALDEEEDGIRLAARLSLSSVVPRPHT